MINDELGRRSREFAIDVLRFCLRLEQDPLGQVAQPALLRAGTTQATQYRAAVRSRSGRELASRLAAVIHSLDIAEFWLEVLLTLKYGPGTAAHQLHIEAQELRATLSAFHVARTDARRFAMAPAGDYEGLPATGRRVTMVESDVVRVVNGKIAEERSIADLAALDRQLKAPAAAGQ